MHFLVDASMPRGTAPLIQSRGHQATDVRDIGLGGAPDPDIAAHAQAQQLAILSRDFDFADIRLHPPDQFHGIAVIDLRSTSTTPAILNLVDDFLQQTQILNDLPGRLAIVAPGRTRLRHRP
jgi:predicted nuclease of predicted toxin-antitoxin system